MSNESKTEELKKLYRELESEFFEKKAKLEIYKESSKDWQLLDKDQRIKELQEQLANAIVLPKYEKGQPIYYICAGKVIEAYFQHFNVDIDADVIENPHEVTDDDGFTDIDYDLGLVDYRLIYATREEAEAKLKEMKSE